MAEKLLSVLQARRAMRLNSLSLQKSEPENATGSREQANLDQVTPFVDLGIDLAGRYPVGVLRDHDLGAASFKLFDDPVDVESVAIVARTMYGWLLQGKGFVGVWRLVGRSHVYGV